jgi:membrane-associated protein
MLYVTITSMDYLIHYIQIAGYFGYVVLFLIIFFESLPPTFFLPGDSLLFISGFFVSQGYFNMILLVLILFIASVVGYIVSYLMGEKIRDFILKSNDKYWFKKKHIEYTEEFYKKYGAKTLVIGRFVPIVRSFSPMLAGTVDMKFNKFIPYVLIGGFLWTGGLTSIGFYLGKTIPHADRLLTPIVICIIFVSLLPAVIEYVNKRRKDNKKNVEKI